MKWHNTALRRAEVPRLAGSILKWYTRDGRSLPWRNTRNPYRILISEIMLQQTQVQRVLRKYPEFLRKFPSMRALAGASRREVVMVWRGMGYNNRAVRLHILARVVAGAHGSRLPESYEALSVLPGIGKYTAHALLSFAFHRHVPVVDVNVRRVLSRIFWKMESTASLQKEGDVWELAALVLPEGRAYDWNQALMDLGAMVCTARAPRCQGCPVASLCSSRAVMKRAVSAVPKREPSLGGIPNRVYRGKLVELLRGTRGPIRLEAAGRKLYGGFSGKHEPWLVKLVKGLERDGLVTVAGTGPMLSRRVALA